MFSPFRVIRQESIRQLLAERDVWQKRIAELERENTETQGALHAEMLDTSDLHSENASLKDKVRELEGQCKAWRQHYRDEHRRRLKLQQSALETEATIAALKDRIGELESQVADGTRIAMELSQTIDDLQSGIGSNPTA